MVLQNELHVKYSAELARCEEKNSKSKAKQLYDAGLINNISIGTFDGLAIIHNYLFSDIYEFVGEICEGNGRSMRICLALMLRQKISKAVD
ncbi:hypothetical protein [Weissella hellenica]|uniref:Cell filamentation protein n=1 Tax=Weissella hellenica TaxID=46256 RepID=A0A4Y4G1C8_WEIHE|nr:hypothetical protein [Weissella hellenica]NKY66158.1 hypothetical protein [Weissella hellenica]GED35617.1 hypothetical protein WHE01_05210 [Weissella hellenica]SCB78880.1 cell filamentation protein [Weissella hellenica]